MKLQYLVWALYAAFWLYDWRKSKQHQRAINRLESDNVSRIKEIEALKREVIELQLHTKFKRA